MDKIVLTKETAREWAIKKWQSILDHGGRYHVGVDAVPELNQFVCSCAYCTFYGFNNMDKSETFSRHVHINCKNCPINLESDQSKVEAGSAYCVKEGHPFMTYRDEDKAGDITGATAVLELIINSPDKI